MKDLEKMIRNRKEEFDIHEPSDRHLDKFLDRLQRKSFQSLFLVRIAAIVTIMLVISAATYIFLGIDSKRDLSAYSAELRETLFYYNNLNLEIENEIMSIPIGDKEEKSQIQQDIENYNANYPMLVRDLEKFPNDERIINAVIEYHRSKSEMLELILHQLKQRNV